MSLLHLTLHITQIASGHYDKYIFIAMGEHPTFIHDVIASYMLKRCWAEILTISAIECRRAASPSAQVFESAISSSLQFEMFTMSAFLYAASSKTSSPAVTLLASRHQAIQLLHRLRA